MSKFNKHQHTKIYLIDPKWGDNTYPYYFGTMKEVIKSGADVVIIKEKIKSVTELVACGLSKRDVVVFGYGWLEVKPFITLRVCVIF